MTTAPVDLQHYRDEIARPDAELLTEAAERQRSLIKPPGALGRLEALGSWVASVQGQCPPRPFERVRAVVFAGDHGVAARGVSAYPGEVTAQLVSAVASGTAPVNAVARAVDATIRIVDISVAIDVAGLPPSVSSHKVRRSTGDISVEDAMSSEQTEAAFAAGAAIADEEIDAGADLLVPGDLGIGNSTPAATLIGLLSTRDAGAVTGRGSGIDDETWIRKAAAVRDAMRRGRPVRGNQLELLTRVGGPDFAAATGFLLQAAERRTPVVLDGLMVGACAMLAHRIAYRSSGWWQAGHRCVEPAHDLVLARLQLEPLLEYQMHLGQCVGGLLAVPLLRAAQSTLTETATFEDAGVAPRLPQSSDPREPDDESEERPDAAPDAVPDPAAPGPPADS